MNIFKPRVKCFMVVLSVKTKTSSPPAVNKLDREYFFCFPFLKNMKFLFINWLATDLSVTKDLKLVALFRRQAVETRSPRQGPMF